MADSKSSKAKSSMADFDQILLKNDEEAKARSTRNTEIHRLNREDPNEDEDDDDDEEDGDESEDEDIIYN